MERSAADSLDFDATLSTLLALVGEVVGVHIWVGRRGESSITAAMLQGVLKRTENRGPSRTPDDPSDVKAWRDHDSHFFVIGKDDSNGFYLDQSTFGNARPIENPHGRGVFVEMETYATSVTPLGPPPDARSRSHP
jgi:hypothetical protein